MEMVDKYVIGTVIHKGKAGEIYNIGGNNELENIEVVKLILRKIGKTETLIQYVADRLGHDRRYAIDQRKITTELGWSPIYSFEDGIMQTINWYMDNQSWLENKNPFKRSYIANPS